MTQLDRAADQAPAPRRRPHVARWASAAVGVVVVALIVLLATSKKPTETADSPLLGRREPSLTGRGIDGRPFDIADQSGRWVVVNFFASWCVPCQQEAPELRKWSLAHQATGDAILVNVVFQDSAATAKAFLDRAGGASWPVVVTDTDTIGLDWGVAKVPETYLVSPSGFVVWKSIQPVTQAGLDRVIAEIQRRIDSASGASS